MASGIVYIIANANGGNFADGNINSGTIETNYGGATTIAEFLGAYAHPTRVGYILLGWSKNAKSSIPDFTNDSICVLSDIGEGITEDTAGTIYAVWRKVNKYLISESELTYLADVIRDVTGATGKLSFPNGFVNAINPPIYGYSRDLTDSNPDTCITYIDDNSSFSAAKMCSDTFDYGSWKDAWFMPKPCMLKFDGTVESYLNPNDYTKTTTEADSNVTNSTTANAMMQWPVIWVYREYSSDGNTYKFHAASYQVDDNYKCLANINANGDIVPFYTSIYNASLSNSKYRSLSGETPSVSNSVETGIAYATANGSGWYIDVLVDRLLINDLLVLIGKSTNTQATFGMGYCSVSSAQSSGFGDTKGLFWGDTSDGSYGVKVFGMENWWGNIFRRTAGHLIKNGIQRVKLTYGTQDGSTTTGYSTTGDGYISTRKQITSDGGGYISNWIRSEYGLIPRGHTGTDTTYDCDYFFATTYGEEADTYSTFGGCFDMGAHCGAFNVYFFYTPESETINCGFALSYK